jgi:heme oxygenase
VDQASRSLLELNLETRSHHAAADAPWLELVRPGTTLGDYRRRLIKAYGFAAPLEAAFAYTPNLRLVIDLRERSRAGLIAQDLMRLGMSPGEVANLPQTFPLAPFGAPIEALGWMYVDERATLLHETIRRQIIQRVPVAAEASTYLGAYAGHTSARWEQFGHVLERVVRTRAMFDELLAGAHAGFRTLFDWNRSEPTTARRVS